ncbi:hypothetical protein BpHYR1_024261 [Brachionus plicatilis]|uniref:SWIM-type domain-containing protein n=1 Tax=Brachionus plicatilis TaxID=10195 RepID=A0A3M7SYP9_BRAPC|nr:hypothetical protein BpHYR1_024261 [Brachionus plicatilis]
MLTFQRLYKVMCSDKLDMTPNFRLTHCGCEETKKNTLSFSFIPNLIQGWVCECKVGHRTLGCCSHITAYQSKIDDPGSTLLRLLGINVSEDDSENEDYTEYIESFEDFNVIKYLTHSLCKILHRKRFSTATNLLKVGRGRKTARAKNEWMCGMVLSKNKTLQAQYLHNCAQLDYSKTSLRRWPTRRSPMLQQANKLDLLRWETIGSHP